ncbi:MAG: hypothetical protein RLN76_10840 [Phycisphaeraceae bacterium]
MKQVARLFEIDCLDAQGVMRRRIRLIARDLRHAEGLLRDQYPQAMVLRCEEIAAGKLVPAKRQTG